ncbi:MAG: helix-turn-helix transcriptional regulator [Methanobrevibacter sp.]|nr:helix-turn-helix transcriptional regulator [Methanobrevibacter sp.]
MAKKYILALIILVLIAFFAFNYLGNNSVDIYIDGENVSVTTHSISGIDTESLNKEICDYTINLMNDTTSDFSDYENGVKEICIRYGIDDAKINIDSSIGKNQIPVIVNVDGTSMLPTLQDGQQVLVNKSHDVNVGDIVVAESDEYGGIIKRVDDIEGDSIHLVSDNKDVSYEYINGALYEIKGISTWVDINDIGGVVIQY